MDKRILLFATVAAVAAVAAACNPAPTTAPKTETAAAKEPARPPEAVSAQRAYYEMYKLARNWAPDLLALSVASGEVAGIQNQEGKAGMWTAVFVSPSRKEARKLTYAVVSSAEEDIRQGVSVSDTLPWGGATPASKPFSNSEFVVDSDAAYKAAEALAASWLKSHPNQKATLQLGNASRFPAPVWYIMWGTKQNGYAALINSVTGAPAK